jgi:hypothetical protein
MAIGFDAAEGGGRMYDPGGMLKDFKLQAHPEACTGTPESNGV